MGINSSKIKKKEELTRICEAFEDADVDHCKYIFETQDMDSAEIITIRNHDKRTPLHLACYKGHVEVFNMLIEEHNGTETIVDLQDKRGDTPLNLACSHGYDSALDLDMTDNASKKDMMILEQLNRNKTHMIEMLLSNGAEIRNSIKKNRNSPLHWCMYYGNYDGGMLLFNEFPLIIFDKNEEGLTPLEILIQKNLMKPFKKEAKRLARNIISKFATALFNNDDKFINKNAYPDEIKQIEAIKKLRKQSENFSFNVNDILDDMNENVKHGLLANIHKANAGEYIEDDDEGYQKLDMEEEEEEVGDVQEQDFSDAFNKKKDHIVKTIPGQDLQRNDFDSSIEIEESLREDKLNKNLLIYDDKHKKLLKNEYLVFLHKLLFVAIYVKELEVIQLLMDHFMVSPFVKSINDYTGLQYASKLGRYNIVQFFTENTYTYFESSRVFKLQKHINKKAGPENSTCLHLAALKQNRQVFELLIDKGANINAFNYRDFRPLDLTRDEFFKGKEKELFDELENKELLDFGDIMDIDNWQQQKIQLIREDYLYLIISRDTQEDYTKSLVYQQLEIAKETWQNKMDIKVMLPMVKEVNGVFRFYFLINLHQDIIDTMADYYNLEVLNSKKGYNQQFYMYKRKEYGKFRDYHIHKILLAVLNKEFDVDHYKKAGIIEQIFPIHEFRTRMNLYKNWKKERSTVFFDPWKVKSNPKDLRPFNSLAFYYGCDLSLYISFTILYTSFLSLISVVGVAIYIWILVTGQKLDNWVTPIYALLISLWVSFTIEKWKRRQNEHAFIWNTLNYKSNELVRKDYQGFYSINSISKKITKHNSFSTYYRRLIVG